MTKYPRVLLITHNSFNFNKNNGKTFNSLFHNWDSNSIAQLFFINEIPESKICNSYFRITDKDVLKSSLRLTKNQRCGGKISVNENTITHQSKNNNLSISSFSTKIKKNILIKILRDYIWSKNYWKTNSLKKWLTDFQPDVILLGVGNYAFSANIAYWISEFLNKPLCLYYGDDYFINTSSKWGVSRLYFNKIKRAHDRNVKHAKKIIAIGDLMAFEYHRAYNKDVVVVRTSVDLNYNIIEKEKSKTKSIVISYLGGLHLNRWKSIVELGKLLQMIQPVVQKKIVFNIYSMSVLNDSIITRLNKEPLKFCGSVSGDIVKSIMQNSDILVHVESFEKKYRKLTRLSISTKIPEYLSTEKCILGYGPNEVASIRLLSDNNIGLTLTDKDTEEMKTNKLLSLLNNKNKCRILGENARIYAENKFSREINNEKLRLVLSDAIETR